MRKTSNNLIILTNVFIVGLLLSNILGARVINVFGLVVPGAIMTYPLTFLVTDIIGEIWGKEEANFCVKTGIMCQILFVALAFLTFYFFKELPFAENISNQIRAVVFSSARMSLSSLGAFIASQFLDVYIFHKLKARHGEKHKWIRNNASTLTSQFIDTIVFISIAFYGVVPDLRAMIISQYIVKIGLALLDTPFFYAFTRKK